MPVRLCFQTHKSAFSRSENQRGKPCLWTPSPPLPSSFPPAIGWITSYGNSKQMEQICFLLFVMLCPEKKAWVGQLDCQLMDRWEKSLPTSVCISNDVLSHDISKMLENLLCRRKQRNGEGGKSSTHLSAGRPAALLSLSAWRQHHKMTQQLQQLQSVSQSI